MEKTKALPANIKSLVASPDDLEAVRALMEESETDITMPRTDNLAYIYTSDNLFLTRVKRMWRAYPDAWAVTQVYRSQKTGEVTGYEITTLKSNVLLRSGKPVKYSEEQKEQSRNRLKAMRENRAGASPCDPLSPNNVENDGGVDV